LAIDSYVVSSVVGSTTNYSLQLQLAGRVSKFLLIDVLVEFSHLETVIPDFSNKSLELFKSWNLCKRVRLDAIC